MRLYTLKFYFKDSPHPWTFKEVSNFSTEGGLVRLVQSKKSQWFPLCNIFRIQEVDVVEVD